jgi:hypothetical protein
MMVQMNTGKGKDTSLAIYEAAVAADTTEVREKSNRRRTALMRARVLVDTLSLGTASYEKHRIIDERAYR